MRKKNFRKGVSLVLVASMSAAMLAGCGGQEEEGKKEAQGGKNDVPTYTIATVPITTRTANVKNKNLNGCFLRVCSFNSVLNRCATSFGVPISAITSSMVFPVSRRR